MTAPLTADTRGAIPSQMAIVVSGMFARQKLVPERLTHAEVKKAKQARPTDASASADQEINIALQAALEAVLDMPQRGVTSPHVIPTALVMVALPLMEATTSRAAIAAWLLELHEAYVEEPEQESGLH